MIDRLLIVLALAVLVAVCWMLLRLRQARRLRSLGDETLFSGVVPAGRPAVVAFSVPRCSECHDLQEPALSRLEARLGDKASVKTISAQTHGALAKRLGILTVPSTAVLDASGAVRFVNQGFTDEGRLAQQIDAIVQVAGR